MSKEMENQMENQPEPDVSRRNFLSVIVPAAISLVSIESILTGCSSANSSEPIVSNEMCGLNSYQ